MQTSKRRFLLGATALGLGVPGLAHAHGNEGHAKKGPAIKEQKDWGIAGDARAVKRSIDVSMGDDMRFKPDRIEVRQGETLRFRVRNSGRVMHEFVIGTKAENYMAHVPPGKSGEIVWNFNRAGTFEFACLIAGHYQAGMVGTITVTPGGQS
jgi:uncharacterized cupredoxin-like copper-binding protein